MTGFAGADRRQWWGFTDLGPIQIPPNPKYLVLTDRVTGTLYWVTFNLNVHPSPDGAGHVVIYTQLPADPPRDRPTKNAQDPRPFIYNNVALYDAFAEPIIGFWDDVHFGRLIVTNGTLGVSAETLAQGRSNTTFAPPVYLIQTFVGAFNPFISFNQVGFLNEFVQIILAPSSSFSNPNFTWVAFQLQQTPNPPNVNSAANLSNPKADV